MFKVGDRLIWNYNKPHENGYTFIFGKIYKILEIDASDKCWILDEDRRPGSFTNYSTAEEAISRLEIYLI